MAPPIACYVIFGAAVRPGGRPSGTLRRRVEGALAAGGASGEALYLVTGGVGRHPPAEADVMAGLLEAAGVPGERILRDTASDDTLSSALAVARIVRERCPAARIVVCTSRFHQPRCRLLLRLAGLAAESAPMHPDRPGLGPVRWLYYVAREAVALPWDAVLMVARRALSGATWP